MEQTDMQGDASNNAESISVPRAGVAIALRRLGLAAPTRETVVLEVWMESALPPSAIWATWSNVERWPCWSRMHRSVTWITSPGWRLGAQFEQIVEYPVPLSIQRETITVERVEPGSLAVLTRTHAGVRACHVWRFELTPAGGTLVSDELVMHGLPMQVLGPMIAPAWQRQSQAALRRLLTLAAGAAAQHYDGGWSCHSSNR